MSCRRRSPLLSSADCLPPPVPGLPELFERVIRDAPYFVGIADAQFRPCFLNEAGRRLVGLAPDADISAYAIADFFAPDERAMIEEVALPTLTREGAWEGHCRFNRFNRFNRFDDGEAVPVTWNTFLLRDAGGETIGAAAITTDLTARWAQALLKDSRARLKAACDLVGLTSYRWSPMTGELHWDAQLKALWGLPADAVVDEAVWLAGIHPDDRARAQGAAARAADPDGDGVYAIEYRVTGHAGGPERWICTRGQTVFEGGEAVAFTGAVLDVTEQKHLEAQLRRSEAYLATILDQLPVGVGVFDSAGRLVLGNAALERSVIGDMPSRNPIEARRWRAFRPDGSSLPSEDYPGARAMRGEVTFPGTEFLHRLESGAEVWTRIGAAPLRDAGGAIQGVVTIVEDVDQQRRSEIRLRESEERFRRFAENSGDVIWIYDAVERRLDYLSPAFQQTWGIDPQPVLADRDLWRASVHPEDRCTAEQALRRALSHGETFTVKYRIVRPDGAIRWIRDTGFPIRGADGRIVQVGGIAQDVTRDTPLSVYIVDPDPQATTRGAALLSDAGYAVTTFASERAFLEVAGALTPGCVVVRTEDASPARFELARLLRAQRIVSPVVFETDLSGDVALAIGAMKAGAADVLEAPCDPEVLLSAVATALASIGAAAAEDEAAKAARTQIATMSPREREVLEGLLSGGTNKTIARDLGISPRTVEIHRAHVMERLGAQTLPQAVLAATSAGMKPAQRPFEPDLA